MKPGMRTDPDPRLGLWGRTNELIRRAAEGLGLGVEELTDVHSDAFLRLVRGDASWIVAKTRSPRLTVLAQRLANNKYTSRRLLTRAGLPLIEHALIEDLDDPRDLAIARQMLDAHRVLCVKPNWGNRAHGVVTGICDLETLARAFDVAVAHCEDEEVLVERFSPGEHLRVAVIGGVAVAAAIIEHARAVGDGTRTLRELVEQLDADPRRGDYDTGAITPLDRIDLEGPWLEAAGAHRIGLDTRLAAGQVVPIWTEEAETIDVTDALPPGFGEIAVRACEVLGVDVGGVDLMVEGGLGGRAWLLEVNVLPALHLHALPTRGRARPVFEAFVAHVIAGPPSLA
jgi:cyanophycin synthetase